MAECRQTAIIPFDKPLLKIFEIIRDMLDFDHFHNRNSTIFCLNGKDLVCFSLIGSVANLII